MSETPERKAFLLRLDPAVAAAVEAMAAQELRSVNGQIEWLLREALARRGRSVNTTMRTNARRPKDDK
ncbi:MAG TPA: DNA-binding protein [Steroidobacteraceae bacterium]|nr:DNA-binding protein [Steroidobacteraceae bacterium]